MNDNLQVLREIGAQKIHSDTHISREFVQALIHESFEDLQSVQFFGFVSIIEKTYGLDLEELKVKARAYFYDEDSKSKEEKKIFVVAKKKKNNIVLSMFLIFLVFLFFLYYLFVYVNSLEETAVVIDNTKIENAQKNLEIFPRKNLLLFKDENQSNEILLEDNNITEEMLGLKELDINISEQKIEKIKALKVVRSLKILLKRKLWVGYINIETKKRYGKIFKENFSLDTSKDWLLLFGKGTAKLEINGEIKKFSSQQSMRFKYVAGKFKKITVREFKLLNKGSKW